MSKDESPGAFGWLYFHAASGNQKVQLLNDSLDSIGLIPICQPALKKYSFHPEESRILVGIGPRRGMVDDGRQSGG
ncbi:MAG: hypothetical protein ACOC3W_11635 [Thermodesulfobacteriota bacterium]